MTEQKNMTDHPEKQLHRVGDRPGYRTLHEVCVTKDLGSEKS
jgi:hypothetical protein